jgi:hypothetical protein
MAASAMTNGGIGIDLAEPDTFAHLDRTAIVRAAHRWLTPSERAWCARQPSFRRAMVTVLSCKESVYKAWSGAVAVHDVELTLEGEEPLGWASASAPGQEPVTLWWNATSEHILSVAVAGHPELADRIIRGRCGAESG